MRLPLLVALLGFSLPACHSIKPPEDTGEARSADDWRVPEKIFGTLVEHAKAGNREAVAQVFEDLLLTQEEMVGLFGEGVGQRVWKGYSEVIVPDLRREATDVVFRVVEDGMVQVGIDRLGPARPENTTPGDAAMLEAMVKKVPMFNARIYPPEGSLGLRVDGLVFVGGKWKALFKSYLFLGEIEIEIDAGSPATLAEDGGEPGVEAP